MCKLTNSWRLNVTLTFFVVVGILSFAVSQNCPAEDRTKRQVKPKPARSQFDIRQLHSFYLVRLESHFTARQLGRVGDRNAKDPGAGC